MAGLRDPDLVDNKPAAETDATPPKADSSPEVIDLLAALYKRQRQELDLNLAALLQQQQLKGPGTLAEWLNRLTLEPASPFLKGEAPLLILRANLPNATPIHIEPNRITACHNGEKLTPHTAMAMATLALADPAMREKGIELEGTEEEQIILYMALRLHGYDKILNPPKFDPQNNPKHAELYQLVAQEWPHYVTHTPAAPQPQPAVAPEAEAEAKKEQQPAPVNDNAPKAEEPKAEEQKPAEPVVPAAEPVAAAEEQPEQAQVEEPLPPQQTGGDKWLHPDLHNKLMEKHGDAFIASNPNKPVMPERLVNFWNKRLDDKTKAQYLSDLKLSEPFVDSPLAQRPPVTPEAEAAAQPQPEPEEIKPIRELRIEPAAKAAPVVVAPVPAAEKPKRVRRPKKEKEAAAPAPKAEKETKPKRVRKPKTPAAAFEQAASETSAAETAAVESNTVETSAVETTTVETTTTETKVVETKVAGTAVIKTKVPANIFNTAGSLTLPKQHVFLPKNSGWNKLSPAMQDRLQEYVSKIFSESYPDAELPAQADIIAFWDAKQPEERVTLLNDIVTNEEKNAAAETQLRALKPQANTAFAGDEEAADLDIVAAAAVESRSEKRAAPRNGLG